MSLASWMSEDLTVNSWEILPLFAGRYLNLSLFQQVRNFLCLSDLKPILAKMPVYSNWSNGSLLLWISLHWAVMRLGLGELACNYPDVLKHTPVGIYYISPYFLLLWLSFLILFWFLSWYLPFGGILHCCTLPFAN